MLLQHNDPGPEDLIYVDITLLNVQVGRTEQGQDTIAWQSVSNKLNHVQVHDDDAPVWTELIRTNRDWRSTPSWSIPRAAEDSDFTASWLITSAGSSTGFFQNQGADMVGLPVQLEPGRNWDGRWAMNERSKHDVQISIPV